MQTFTPIEYLKIDIANQFGNGNDKISWEDRLKFVSNHHDDLEMYVDQADEPELYAKAVRTLRSSVKGKPTGFIMSLDATASGLQLIACLTNCITTAGYVNLINTGKREDAYQSVCDELNKRLGTDYCRSQLKTIIMTIFYGSTRKPKDFFGEGTKEYIEFYNILNQFFPTPMTLIDTIKGCWNKNATYHQWTLPDGHVVKMFSKFKHCEQIDLDIENDVKVYHNKQIFAPTSRGVPLLANVIHSFDGYVVRQMTRMAHNQGFELIHIHDCFWCSPLHMEKARINYRAILADIASNNYLEGILNEITQSEGEFTKNDADLASEIMRSEYALS